MDMLVCYRHFSTRHTRERRMRNRTKIAARAEIGFPRATLRNHIESKAVAKLPPRISRQLVRIDENLDISLYILLRFDLHFASLLRKIMQIANHGNRDARTRIERHCAPASVQTISTASPKEKGVFKRERKRNEENERERRRVWYALRAAGSHTTGPKERTSGPPFSPSTAPAPPADARIHRSEEPSPKAWRHSLLSLPPRLLPYAHSCACRRIVHLLVFTRVHRRGHARPQLRI